MRSARVVLRFARLELARQKTVLRSRAIAIVLQYRRIVRFVVEQEPQPIRRDLRGIAILIAAAGMLRDAFVPAVSVPLAMIVALFVIVLLHVPRPLMRARAAYRSRAPRS
jgi:hypothetical protein